MTTSDPMRDGERDLARPADPANPSIYEGPGKHDEHDKHDKNEPLEPHEHTASAAGGDSGPRYTLREAAELTGRSVTTLRRYIRAGRLIARKTPGRFGPEYTLDEDSIVAAGLEILVRAAPPSRPEIDGPQAGVAGSASSYAHHPSGPSNLDRSSHMQLPVRRDEAAAPLERVLQDFVPADLYRELTMKHEQLLVQYGMIRASGQRLYEFREEAERRTEDLRRLEDRHKDLQGRFGKETGVLKQHLRSVELEIEDRDQQIGSLREKIRTLELLTRNAVTNETIERQFMEVFEQERRVDELLTDPDTGVSERDARDSRDLSAHPAESAESGNPADDELTEPGKPAAPGAGLSDSRSADRAGADPAGRAAGSAGSGDAAGDTAASRSFSPDRPAERRPGQTSASTDRSVDRWLEDDPSRPPAPGASEDLDH